LAGNRSHQHRRLWRVVRRLILANYDLLMRHSIRGGWYILGDLLATLVGKEISTEEYHWFRTEEQGYATYRDDIWPRIEQERGLQRPEAKAVGLVYDGGLEYPISRLEEAWSRARGFIFVEKADEAGHLAELSRYGWTIVAGQGYPTRLVRQLLKKDPRPVLALHDWDPDGLGIYRALGFETRRTRHLGIALGERVVDLGLHESHVKALDLPLQPSPPKYGGRPRCELSALSVLSVRMGVDNPILAYTIAAMAARGLTLSPLEGEKKVIFASLAVLTLMDLLREAVEEAVVQAAKDLASKLAGTAADAELEGDVKACVSSDAIEDVVDAVKVIVEELLEKVKWKYEADYHAEAMKLAPSGLVEALRAAVPPGT